MQVQARVNVQARAQVKKSLFGLFESMLWRGRHGYVCSFGLRNAAKDVGGSAAVIGARSVADLLCSRSFFPLCFVWRLQRVSAVSCCYYVISTTIGLIIQIKRYNKTQNILICISSCNPDEWGEK